MFRHSRPALAALASACLVIAAACGGSTITPKPTPTPISDPHEVITQSLAAVPAVTSFHLKVEVSGKVNAGALSSGSSSGLGLSGNMDLTGTTVEGDVDVPNVAADLKLAVPGLLGLTGEVIIIDGYAYTKISLQGDKFTKSKLSDLTGSLPVSVPTSLPSASGALTDQVAQLRKALTDAGVTTTLLPDDKIAGQDAYHIQVGLPLDKINSLLASSGGSSAAGMQLDSAAVDFWVYKDGLLPAKLEVKGSASTAGNLDIVVTLSNYNKPVTIAAPDPSQIHRG